MPANRRWHVPGALLALLLGGGCPLTADEYGAILHLPHTAHDVAEAPDNPCGDEGEGCCADRTCKGGRTCSEKNTCAKR